MITGFVILNGGSGYTESSTVTISGGGGAGADIEPIVSGGMVVGVVVISGGSGYTAGPTASVTDPTGSGASAVTVVSGGEVTAIVVTNPGSGYTSPSVDVTGPATASATTSNLIGPISPSGNILPAGYAASRKYRIEITVGGTEVTGDVIWSRTSFTEYAKTGPGGYDPRHWTFATGALIVITAIGEQFGLAFWRDAGGSISHNLRTAVIDAAGRVQKIFEGNTWTSQELAAELVVAAGKR